MMGAHYQDTVIEAGTETELKTKYLDVVEDARYMSGHGGYSGTFAEKYDLRVINGMHNPTTRIEADAHCSKENDKWGPSFAYYLGENRWYVGGWCSS